VLAIGLLGIALERIARAKAPLLRIVPPGAQVDHPTGRVPQFAGEAEARHAAALDLATGVIAGAAEHRAAVAQRQAHRAERVSGVPGACAIRDRGQAVEAIEVLGGAAEQLWLHHWATLLRILYGPDLRTVIDKI
jgi:hypothetical protein